LTKLFLTSDGAIFGVTAGDSSNGTIFGMAAGGSSNGAIFGMAAEDSMERFLACRQET
jgi:hypothetical protein